MQQGIKLNLFSTVKNGQYRIIRHLADGGEGYIYLAQDTFKNGQICVVKQLFHEAVELAGIEEDYSAFASLFHPNVVQVLDFFWENDIFYIVMNYMLGDTMKVYLKGLDKPPSEIVVLSWATKLAHVLSFLHSRQVPIVHADIAPDNIMLTPKGDLVIIDFGISRLNGEAVGIREFYSPPEQIEESKISPASDIYSYGATLFKCLTLKDQPEPAFDPRNYNPSISPPLAELVVKCTKPKMPQLFGLIPGRYIFMEEVIEELSNCRANMTTSVGRK